LPESREFAFRRALTARTSATKRDHEPSRVINTSTSSPAISSGELTLDAGGDVNAVWIFQMGSTLVTTSGRQVILVNGAKAANVFWLVGSSATLGTGSIFKGNILALASITASTGVVEKGDCSRAPRR
jgi:hypothetical protein